MPEESSPLFAPRSDLSADEKRYLEHVLRHKDGVVARRLQWVGDLASIVRRRDRFREQPEMVAMFWIRLYGVVTEYFETQQKEFEAICAEFTGVDLDMPEWESVKEMLGSLHAALEASADLRGSLTREDAIVVEYMRHAHCHVETLLEARRLAPADVDGEELRRVVATRMAMAGNDIALATEVASKISASIERLRTATESTHRVTWISPAAR
jgi:hypothetical protein